MPKGTSFKRGSQTQKLLTTLAIANIKISEELYNKVSVVGQIGL